MEGVGVLGMHIDVYLIMCRDKFGIEATYCVCMFRRYDWHAFKLCFAINTEHLLRLTELKKPFK